MSDDRELVERLAAIDATPRASWVAELRADLDAAWGTGDAGHLDSLRTTTLTLVDHDPTTSEPRSGRRWPILVAAAAAVVIVAAALIATGDDDATPADQPATVTVPPTVPPRALVDPPGGQFEPGTHFVDEVDGTPTPRIFVTIGAGWRDILDGEETELAASGPDPIAGLEHDLGVVGFSRPSAVFADACHWKAGYYPGSVTTVDGLVEALTEQQGWAEVNAPSDISVDGNVGKRIRRIAPTDRSNCDTTPMDYSPRIPQNHSRPYPAFRSWENGSGGGPFEPGEIQILWNLDIDGTVVVINTTQWVPTEAARAEFATVLDSIRISPWSPELTARPLEAPISCDPSPRPLCPTPAVSPDGTLVSLDATRQRRASSQGQAWGLRRRTIC